MQLVATLIGSRDTQIGEIEINSMKDIISENGGNIANHTWLCEGEAADVFFTGGKTVLSQAVQEWAREASLDVVMQPMAGRRKKALLADMESTLIKEEMLEELADFVGLRAKVEEITTRAMNGELDFKAALKERLALLKGLPATILDDLCHKVTITGGAKELVATMKVHGARCIIVSGGFKMFTSFVGNQLGFHADFGNALDIKDGKISGEMFEPVLDKNSKRATLTDTAIQLNISEADICAVGDGANDLPMLLAAGLGIAYHAKPAVQKQANHNIRFANLRGLLWAQGYSANEIITP
jgi:phosphoserine phosphatase